MTDTNDAALRSALDKVSTLEFSADEAEALKSLLEGDDEVSGFAKLGPGQNETFMVEISGLRIVEEATKSLKLGDPTGGQAKLGPGQNETFRLDFRW